MILRVFQYLLPNIINMKNLYILFLIVFTLSQTNAQNSVTFEVNTAMIDVGPNGMYLGGGYFGGSDAHAMSDADGDGTWTVTVDMPNTADMANDASQNYVFFNSPTKADDWGTKEDLNGQSCADAGNYNDRILPTITGNMTISHCFSSCETDGSCPPPPAAPSNVITSYSVDFASDADVFVGDNNLVLAHDTNGYLTVSNTNEDWYGHLRGNVPPMDLTSGTKGISIRVRGQRQSKVMLKLQNGDDYGNNWELLQEEFNYTDVGNWQTITWDISAWSNPYKTYMSAVVFFFDFETNKPADTGADASLDVFDVDDFVFGEFASLSTKNISLSDFTVYPNPATDFVNINSADTIDSYRIYDLTGRVVKRSSPYSNNFRIDVTSLNKGVYLVKLNSGDKTGSIKLIKDN